MEDRRDTYGFMICTKCDSIIKQIYQDPRRCQYCEAVDKFRKNLFKSKIGRLTLWLYKHDKDWSDVLFTPRGKPYIQELGPEETYQVIKRKFLPL